MESPLKFAVTPEDRRRQLLPRQTMFTTAMSAAEVQKRFLFRERFFFALGALFSLGAMWIVFFLLPATIRLSFRWPLFAAAVAFWGLGAAFRMKTPVLQVASFYLGMIALGGACATLFSESPMPLFSLLHPTVLVGMLTVGCAINTLFLRIDISLFAFFLWLGPWLLTAGVIVFFFPAGEWNLLISGMIGLLAAFVLLRAGGKTLHLYPPREYLRAAADVIAVNVLGLWNAFTGRE